MKRIVLGVLACLLAACGSNSSSPTAPSSPTPTPTPTITVSSITVTGAGCSGGGTCTAPGNLQLGATATMSNGTTQTVTTAANWSSSNTYVADVSSSGAVTVHNPGVANMTATYQNVSGSLAVSVTAPWTTSGSGDTVFDMPTYVSRVKVTAHYAANSSNFIVHVGNALLVNELVGTAWNEVDFSGTYITTGGTVQITNSSGVSWTFTQVRQ